MEGFYGEPPVALDTVALPGWQEFMHYLYLPVRIPLSDPDVAPDSGHLVGSPETGQGVFALPRRLSFLGPFVYTAMLDAAQAAAHLVDPYVYVTARRGYASPRNPLNREGWHTDDFGGTDLNYIWSDRWPTRFLLSERPLVIPESDSLSMTAFEALAYDTEHDEQGPEDPQCRIVDGPTDRLLRLTPYVIHDTPVIPEPGGMRSFAKISVSTHRYDLVGNSHNHELDYSWPMHDRQAPRNQPGADRSGGDSGQR